MKGQYGLILWSELWFCWNVWQWQFKIEEMKTWNRKNIALIRILIKGIDSHVIESQVNNWMKKKKINALIGFTKIN